MALVERFIDVVLAYGSGQTGQGAPNKGVHLSGHRVSAQITNSGGASLGQSQIRIYGLSLSLMNDFSTVGKIATMFRKNSVTLLAGDVGSVPAQIFQGTVIAAWADFLGAPDVVFNITCLSGTIEALLPILPSSYPGTADAAVILQNLAAQMNVRFENSGVSAPLSTPYYPGTAREQAKAVVSAARCEWNGIDNGVLAIWPRGGARDGSAPLVSAATGMVGYPTYTATGVVATTLFNPTITIGGKVQVQSLLTPASGTWRVVSLDHDLEALIPGGRWFTQMQLGALGYVSVPVK